MTAPDRSSTDVDWQPYRLTTIALGLAIALNLWTRNGLWLGYSLFGLSVFLVLIGLVRINQLHLPALAVWMVGVGAALHYIGGSLAGLHQIGGPNGLYYAFPWWDNVVHFLGSWAVAVAGTALIAPFVGGRWWLTPLLGTCIAVTVGAIVELYEFVQFVFFATIDQGFYTNTLLDLYYNLLGAASGAFIYAKSRALSKPMRPHQPPTVLPRP